MLLKNLEISEKEKAEEIKNLFVFLSEGNLESAEEAIK